MNIIVFFFILLFSSLAGAVDLHVWQFSMDEEQSKPIIAQFEKEYPDIHIQLQQLSWDFGNDKIITSIIAGNAPDVFEIGSTFGPHFSQSGVLYDMTEDVKDMKDQYLMWEPVTHEGKIYGVPWLVGTRFLFYNKTLFKKAGLDIHRSPQTWSELLWAVEKIKNLGPDIYGYGISVAEEFSPWQTFIPYLWNGGSDVLSLDFSKIILNNRSTFNTLTFYRQLKPFSLLNRQEQIDQLFAAGKVGIILSGAWNFKSIAKTNSSLEYGVATVPTPETHMKPYSFGGGEMLVVLKKSAHPKEAFKFIRYLTSKEVEIFLSKEQKNVLPSLKEALNDPFFSSDFRMKGFSEQMRFTKTPPAHMGWMKMERILSSMIDQVMLQEVSIEKAIQKTSLDLDRILHETHPKGEISDQKLTLWILIGVMILFFVGWFFRNRQGTFGTLSAWILVSPWVLLFLVFSLYPLLYALLISFSSYHVLTSHLSFVGIRNYIEIIKDPEFRRALYHTLFFAVGTVPFTLIISIFLATLIDHGKVPLKSLFQAGFFLPVATSIIVIATLFTYFYSENGFLNFILITLHLPKPEPAWLIHKSWALPAIMAMAVWSSSGYYLILFLAALQSIPESLYEASRLDGANGIQQFFKITLPQLKPMILFVVVINTINSLQVFPEIFTMTKGGPARSTTTIVYYLYEKGFSEFKMGEASSVAYLLALIICVFSYFQMRVLREKM